MAITFASIAIAATVLGGMLWTAFFGGRPPLPYRERSCQGAAWHRSFPDVPKEDIRTFLSTFAKGFGFRDHETLKFTPDDELLEIYRAMYPVKHWPDGLEFETLSKLIEKRYNVSLVGVWNDNLTMGQLFRVAMKQ